MMRGMVKKTRLIGMAATLGLAFGGTAASQTNGDMNQYHEQCRYVIQVASNSDQKQVAEKTAELRGVWEDTRWEKKVTKGQDLYRIIVGFFEGFSRAKSYLKANHIEQKMPGSFVGNGSSYGRAESIEKQQSDTGGTSPALDTEALSASTAAVEDAGALENESRAVSRSAKEHVSSVGNSVDLPDDAASEATSKRSGNGDSVQHNQKISRLTPDSEGDSQVTETAPDKSSMGKAYIADRSRFDARSPISGSPCSLSMKEFTKLVYERNQQILVGLLEWEISKELVNRSKAIFDPKLTGSYQHVYNIKMNATEEILSRGYKEDFEEENEITNAATEGLLPTGGQLRFSYLFENLNNSVSDTREEFQTFLGLNMVHPLLKNAGPNATMVNTRMAEADSEIAFQTYRQNMMLVIARAAASYWDLYSAHEKLKARNKSVAIAEMILKDNRERLKIGKMAETEVLKARAGLALRKSLVSEAMQNLVSAIYSARSFFSSSGSDEKSNIVPIDVLEIEDAMPDFGNSFRQT